MKYTVKDITTIDIFRCFLKDSFPNINIDNENLVSECYKVFLDDKTHNVRTKYDAISSYLKTLRGGKSSSVLSIDYWKSMGWTDIESIKEMIKKEQKNRSPLSEDYYIKRGVDKCECINIIKDIQAKRGKRVSEKYSYEERIKNCKWSKQYWIDRGFSEEDALLEVHKLNGMCVENYDNIDDYRKIIREHSERQKNLYRSNPEKYWKKILDMNQEKK